MNEPKSMLTKAEKAEIAKIKKLIEKVEQLEAMIKALPIRYSS